MTRRLELALLALATTSLLASGSAHAEENAQALSAQEVKDFLETVEKDLTQMMQAGEYARLEAWTRDSVADEATFHVSFDLLAGEERKGFTVLTLAKQDLVQLGRAALGAIPEPSQAVQNYALEIEVTAVDPIGPNAALATTRIVESGDLALPASKEQAQRSGPLRFESKAHCRHLIQRDRKADRLLIGMSACDAHLQMGAAAAAR